MKEYNLNEKNAGITLIALVVTVVVLLILAGITNIYKNADFSRLSGFDSQHLLLVCYLSIKFYKDLRGFFNIF